MIRYSKSYWGLCTLTRWYGSAFPRALPFSLSSGLLAGLLQGFWGDTLRGQWVHPYPYQSFAFIAGFMIVFRCAAASALTPSPYPSAVTAWDERDVSRQVQPIEPHLKYITCNERIGACLIKQCGARAAALLCMSNQLPVVRQLPAHSHHRVGLLRDPLQSHRRVLRYKWGM
jgi:hypothetical protein